MSLSEEQQEWLENAILKGFSYLEVKKKLQKAEYSDDVIKEVLKEYDNVKEGLIIREEENEEEENEFKEKVEKYISDENSSELSWKDKRLIKKFIKNVTQYQKVLSKSIEMFKNEIKYLRDNIEDKKELEREEEYLKGGIIDALMDSKEVLDIENPITGEDANKNNLSILTLDELIILMEDNVKSMDAVTNGRI